MEKSLPYLFYGLISFFRIQIHTLPNYFYIAGFSFFLSQEQVQGGSQSINVCPFVGLGEAVLLRRGKASGAQKNCVLLHRFLGYTGGIKVNEAYMPVLRKEDVGRLKAR